MGNFQRRSIAKASSVAWPSPPERHPKQDLDSPDTKTGKTNDTKSSKEAEKSQAPLNVT